MAGVALIISLASAVTSAGIGVWVALRTRLRVNVTLFPTSMATGVGTFPLAKIQVNVQGKALTVEDIFFEWVAPLPAPEGWGWGPPSVLELGLPPEVAANPLVAEFTAPVPPQAPYFLQDGETKPFVLILRVTTDWGDGTEWAARIRAHVTMSNKPKKLYPSNEALFVFRPDLLLWQIDNNK